MKKLFLLFAFALIALSCEQIQDFIDSKGHGLVFIEGEMKAYFPDKGDTKNYKFNADLAWSAKVSADWVEVKPSSGKAGENKIQIKVEKNKSAERRTGYVDITLSNNKSYRIELEQLAAGENLDDEVESPKPCPSNEIWYTSADNDIVEPCTAEGFDYGDTFSVFGANIVSNVYDAQKECWVITFDRDVAIIGENAFRESSNLSSITIPDGVTTIGYSAFKQCTSLTSVTIPNSVDVIEEWVFENCSSLTSVTISDNLTSVGCGAFLCCNNLTEFNGKLASEDGRCLIIDGTLYSFAPAGLTEYTLPKGVTAIGWYAFAVCSDLIRVTLPEEITAIGYGAFENCYSLKSVNIPDGVTTIGEDSFYCCKSLTSITLPESVTAIEEYAFAGCGSLTRVYCKSTTPPTGGYNMFYSNASGRKIYVPTESVGLYKAAQWWSDYSNAIVGYGDESGDITLPCNKILYTSTDGNIVEPDSYSFGANIVSNIYENGVGVITFDDNIEIIGGWSFYGCTTLKSIAIPDGVMEIGTDAFWDCSSLTDVSIPDSVICIGTSAFRRCASLTSITIPDGVTVIEDNIVSGCSSLTSVTISENVTSIRDRAFYYCENITSVYCKAIIPPTAVESGMFGDWAAFDKNAPGRKIYVPMESVEAYKTAQWWSAYADDIVGYVFENDDITLPSNEIWYTSTDGNIVEPNSYSFGTNIVSNIYENDKGVITFDDNIEIIGGWSFYGCTTLKSIAIPDGVMEIGTDAFWDCSSLTDVSIPDSVICIGTSAFRRCASLTSITIPDGVTVIEDNIVSGCSSLTSVTISENVTSIRDRAFYYCENITSVYCKAIIPPTAVESGMFGDWAAFDKNAPGRKIYVPMESVEAYKAAQWWSAYADDIVGCEF